MSSGVRSRGEERAGDQNSGRRGGEQSGGEQSGARPECPEPHTLLLALDRSENSRRAVDYVARWVACYEAARVVLVHVVKEPSRDVLPDEDERAEYVDVKREVAERLLASTREALERAGIPGSRIEGKTLSCDPPDTVVDALLAEKDQADYDTIVVGRRGMSKKEEYIFGSVTTRLIREASDVTVWVVE